MSRISAAGAHVSTSTTREGGVRSNFSATTASTGSTISRLATFAFP